MDNSNIDIVTGDPKKAINKLSWPIIASLFLIFANNIIDSIWVSGLGEGPLAALGYITPMFMILVGIGNGVGAGANSLISRYIGAEDKNNADNAALHSIILSIIVSVAVTLILLISLDWILKIMGAMPVFDYCKEYGLIIFTWSFTILMVPILAGAFRAEGDIRKATVPMALTAILNMILDPIFIYIIDLKIAGAAWATVIASLIGLILMFYWILIKKDSYLNYDFKKFKNKLSMYKDILVVGIPASLEQLIMAALGIIMNSFITLASGATAIAVFTAGWRIVQIGMLPAIGVGTAAISVAGVAYGARKFENIRITLRYAAKVGFIASIVVCIVINLFSSQIAYVFSYSSASANLSPLIAKFLSLMCLFILFVPFGASAGNVFQGVGKGTTSFILTTIREFVLVLIFAYLLGFTFNLGEYGIYYGMLLGGLIGSIIAYGYIELFLSKLIKRASNAG